MSATTSGIVICDRTSEAVMLDEAEQSAVLAATSAEGCSADAGGAPRG